MPGSKNVKKDDNANFGKGSIPASSVTRDDAMYLDKAAHLFGVAVYQAVLSGTRDEVNGVENQSQNNTQEFTDFDPKTYSGPLKQAVDDWVAKHPHGRRTWP